MIERFVIVHENEDGEELERGEIFSEEGDGAYQAEQVIKTINFFEGDSLRMIRVDPKKTRRRGRARS